MDAGAFVAFAGVAPIEDVDASVWTIAEIDAAKPIVAEKQAIVAMFANVAGAAAFQNFLIGSPTEVIQHVQLATIRIGPVVAEVNHGASMSVAAAVGVRFAVARVGPAFADIKVPVIGVHLEQLVDMLVRIDGVRHIVMRAGDDVPQLATNGAAAEHLAKLVPIASPRVHRSVRNDFDEPAPRMEAPHAAAKQDALGVGCSRLSNCAGR